MAADWSAAAGERESGSGSERAYRRRSCRLGTNGNGFDYHNCGEGMTLLLMKHVMIAMVGEGVAKTLAGHDSVGNDSERNTK